MPPRQPSTAPIPAFIASDAVHWFLCPEGIYRHADGPGLARLGWTASDLLGRPFAEVYADRPDILDMWRAHLFAGRPFKGVMEFGGLLWSVRAGPVYGESALLGVMGTSTVLEPERTADVPAAQVLAAAGDHLGYAIESGDQFIRRKGVRGVTLVRRIADAVFDEYRAEDPNRVHLIRDFPPEPLRLLR
jgi:hypothetical protein